MQASPSYPPAHQWGVGGAVSRITRAQGRGADMSNVIQLHHAVRLHGSDGNIISEICTITPAVATQWLRANRNNRPVRKRHISFLASEILSGNWQVNGQAIIIADTEDVLDGQHRLLA